MNYKRLCQLQAFGIVVMLGVGVDHDSYHMWLAIASAIAAYFLACSFFKSKVGRLLFFALVSVVFCQLSVTVKKAVMDGGFKQVLQQKPMGVLFSDVLYGFRHVAMTVYSSFGGLRDALVYDQYSSVESLNYRFFTIAIAIVVMAVFILKERTTREAQTEVA